MIRVLIAEDEPPILRRTRRLIEHIDADFSVAATAGDGEEALEKLRAEHFDVLFTDIRMPVMDGMKLMNTVQKLYPDCSIVVLSGYQDFEYVSTAVRAQAVDYLLKPVAEETSGKAFVHAQGAVYGAEAGAHAAKRRGPHQPYVSRRHGGRAYRR